jgi:hypothetical protein
MGVIGGSGRRTQGFVSQTHGPIVGAREFYKGANGLASIANLPYLDTHAHCPLVGTRRKTPFLNFIFNFFELSFIVENISFDYKIFFATQNDIVN